MTSPGRTARRDRVLAATALAMVVTDVGFIAYWALIITDAIPAQVMFEGYEDVRVAAWNWSFLPLDLSASLLGLSAVRALRAKDRAAPARLAASLALTTTAGGMAVVYWAQLGEFDIAWWVPNLFLLLFPLPLLARLARTGSPSAPA